MQTVNAVMQSFVSFLKAPLLIYRKQWTLYLRISTPFVKILEARGEIDEKPIKNDAKNGKLI